MLSITLAVGLVLGVPALSLGLHRLLLPRLPLWPYLSPGRTSAVVWLYDQFGCKQMVPSPPDRFRWLNVLLVPLSFVSIGALTASWAFALVKVGGLRWRALPEGAYLVRPEPFWALFLMPSLFLGLLTSLLPLGLVIRLLAGRHFDEYALQEAMRQENARRPAPGLIIFGVLALAEVVALTMSYSTTFLPEGMVVCSPSNLSGTVHPYDTIDRVVVSSHARTASGKEVERKRCVIRFTDGTTWRSESYLRTESCKKRDEQALRRIFERAGKPVVDVRFLEEDP